MCKVGYHYYSRSRPLPITFFSSPVPITWFVAILFPIPRESRGIPVTRGIPEKMSASICNGLHIKYQICNKFWLAVTVCRVDGNATCLVWTQFRGTTGHGLNFGIIDFHLTSHCLLKSQRTRISINGRLTVQIKSLSLCPYFCNSC